jgi:hypothetical protein
LYVAPLTAKSAITAPRARRSVGVGTAAVIRVV